MDKSDRNLITVVLCFFAFLAILAFVLLSFPAEAADPDSDDSGFDFSESDLDPATSCVGTWVLNESLSYSYFYVYLDVTCYFYSTSLVSYSGPVYFYSGHSDLQGTWVTLNKVSQAAT